MTPDVSCHDRTRRRNHRRRHADGLQGLLVARQFVADQPRHLNEPEWFQPPKLFGFEFTEMEVRPYQRLPGWMRFFPVKH